ncbi:hypothetical protein GCM10023263_75190 [Phytohabitans rumicis]
MVPWVGLYACTGFAGNADSPVTSTAVTAIEISLFAVTGVLSMGWVVRCARCGGVKVAPALPCRPPKPSGADGSASPVLRTGPYDHAVMFARSYEFVKSRKQNRIVCLGLAIVGASFGALDPRRAIR